MGILFIVSASIAVFASIMAITRRNAVHALLFLVASLIAIAMMIYTIGAPYAAILEIIIYAGAIMMLFVFTIMMLNLSISPEDEKRKTGSKTWILPAILGLIVFSFLAYSFLMNVNGMGLQKEITAKQVSIIMFNRYMLIVQLAGFLLLIAVVGAYYLGRTKKRNIHRYLKDKA